MNTFYPEASKSEKQRGQRSLGPVSARIPDLWSSAGCRGQQPLTQPQQGELHPEQRPCVLVGLESTPTHPLLWYPYNSSESSPFNTISVLLINVTLMCISDFMTLLSTCHSHNLKNCSCIWLYFAGNLYKLFFGQHCLYQHTSHTEKLLCPLCKSEHRECCSPSVEPLFWQIFVKCSGSSIKGKR